jgi:hypothetical protein
MELDEMILVLQKLNRIGLARCESCNGSMKFTEAVEMSGLYLCPQCILKAAWNTGDTIELKAE